MSLKITDPAGFVIGGAHNPDVTAIYVRLLPNTMEGNKRPIYDNEGNIVKVEINLQAKVTLDGGEFSERKEAKYIYPYYGSLQYDASLTSMDAMYLELENELKSVLIAENPNWSDKIEIVNIGVGPVTNP